MDATPFSGRHIVGEDAVGDRRRGPGIVEDPAAPPSTLPLALLSFTAQLSKVTVLLSA
jgi:hypothetical protein